MLAPDRAPLHLLLELDRGTEPLRRIREKVARYAKALPRSELATATPLIVFAAPTSRRADSISKIAADVKAVRTKVAVWARSSSLELTSLLNGR